LKDTSELPSLREFEELARQALGPELALSEQPAATTESSPAASGEAEAPLPGEISGENPPETAPPEPSAPPAESAAVEAPASDGATQAERKS
jgi:hypothetical protein